MPVPSPADEAAHLLEAKPHSVRAHVLMGDHHAAKDDEQNAVYYYRRALRLAEMQDLDDRDIGQARKALLQALIERAHAFGFRQLVAVIGGGEPASIALHAKFGFREVGRLSAVGWKQERWLDSVYMQLELPDAADY